MRWIYGVVQNAREKRASSQAPCNLLCKAPNPIDPACTAARLGGGAEGRRWAASEHGGAACFGELNHITSFVTHEIPGSQYHRRPDSSCLRSCQSPPAMLPAKLTPSSLQAGWSLLITPQPLQAWKSGEKAHSSPFVLAFPFARGKGSPSRWGSAGVEMQTSPFAQNQRSWLLFFRGRCWP